MRSFLRICGNSALLAVMLLAGAHIFNLWSSGDLRPAPSYYAQLSAAARANYQHMTEAQVNDLEQATWRPGWVYEPWTGFREKERSSAFVNVDAAGIRANRAGGETLARLDNATWFFGGSTTFGYGVTDQETIPAQVESLLGTPVVNLGRAYFYSAQEDVLLWRYLNAGFRPSAAWFLDGLNERCDLDVYQHELAVLFARAEEQDRYRWDYAEIVQPLRHLLTRLGLVSGPAQPADIRAEVRPDTVSCEKYGRTQALSAVVADQLKQRESLCRAYGVRCTTFVQPFAGVHGVHRDGTLTPDDRAEDRKLFTHLEGAFRDAGAVFVTGALDHDPRHAYVDDVHYSAWASRAIATAIVTSAATDGSRH